VTRVLLVDDNALLLRSLTRVLTRAGFDVVAHDTLAGAEAALRDDPTIAVVLTDLRLGTDTGLDLIAIARQREPAPAVVVLSGVASPDDVAAALAAGAAALIRKPVQPSELVDAVSAAARPPDGGATSA
jgi:two-component system response regulator RegA